MTGLDLFLERGIILNAIFLKTASKFGNPGGTYPPKSYPSTPRGVPNVPAH